MIGLAAPALPPALMMISVHQYLALTSDRPYRRGRSAGLGLDEIREHSGTQFCPRVVEQLAALYRIDPRALAEIDDPLAGAA